MSRSPLYSPSSSVRRSVHRIKSTFRRMGIQADVSAREGAILGGHGLSYDGEVIVIRGELPSLHVRTYVRGLAPRRAVVWWRSPSVKGIAGDGGAA